MKKWYYIILVVSFLGILACFGLQFWSIEQQELENDHLLEQMNDLKVYETGNEDTSVPEVSPAAGESEPIASDIEVPDPVDSESAGDVESTAQDTTTNDETTAGSTSPASEPLLDFDAIREVNPDIHAWISIAGLKLDYPVLQHPTDDEWYLRRAYDKSDYIGGCLFTQCSYNSTDFNDPVTVIYGHTMRSGAFFGELQKVYTDAKGFFEHNDITIYLPGEVRHYTVFAAVPYDSIHILHTYDFSNEYWFNNFFKSVFSVRALGAQFDSDQRPSYGDRVIILSTCLNQDSTQRFLVMARLAET